MFVPVFFVMTGVTFDLDSLLSSPSIVFRVIVFDVILLAAGLLPALLTRRHLGTRRAVASGFLLATSLSLLVVVVSLGQELGQIRPENTTALTAAGMVSVLVFPMIAQALLGKGRAADEAEPREPDMGESL